MNKKTLIIIITIIISFIFAALEYEVYNQNKLSKKNAEYAARKKNIDDRKLSKEQSITKKTPKPTNIENTKIFYFPFIIEADSIEIRKKIKMLMSSSDIWNKAIREVVSSYKADLIKPVFQIKISNIESEIQTSNKTNFKLIFDFKSNNEIPVTKKENYFDYNLPYIYEHSNLEILLHQAGLDIYLKDQSNFNQKEKTLIECYKKSKNEEKETIGKAMQKFADQGFFDIQRELLKNKEVEPNNIEIEGEDAIIEICKSLINENFIWQVLIKNKIAPKKIEIKSELKLEDEKNYIKSSNTYIPGTAYINFTITFADGSIQTSSSKQKTPGAVSSQENPYKIAKEKAIEYLLLNTGFDLYSSMNENDKSTNFPNLLYQLDKASYQSDHHKIIEKFIIQNVLDNPFNIQYLFPGLSSTNNRLNDKCSTIIKKTFNETITYIIKGLLHSQRKVRIEIILLLKNNVEILNEAQKEEIIQNIIKILNDTVYDNYDLRTYMFLPNKFNIKSKELEDSLIRIINFNTTDSIKKEAKEALQKLQSL